MKLLTDAQHIQLLDNGRRQAAVRGTPDEIDFEPVVKLFTPDAGATWLLTELDPQSPDIAFGLCDFGLGFPELGSVSIRELSDYRGRLGHTIERDIHFVPTATLSAYAEKARASGRVVT